MSVREESEEMEIMDSESGTAPPEIKEEERSDSAPEDVVLNGEEEPSDATNEDEEMSGRAGEEEEEEKKPLDYDDDNGARRVLRKRSAREISDDPPEDEEEDEEDEEEDEEEEDEFAAAGKGKDEHTLLASSAEGVIHVGSEYQAVIVNAPEGTTARDDDDRDTPLWIPPSTALNEDELMEYCEEAMGIYMLGFDRALYILQRSDYDYKKALDTISARRVIKEEWSDDDNQLFRQAFCLYGKNFARIKQIMPHRSMAAIIHHYYATKKLQDYKSLMEKKSERQERREKEEEKQLVVHGRGRCENCFEEVDKLFRIVESHQCNTCALFFKLMAKVRPVPRVEQHSFLPAGSARRRGVNLPEDLLEIVDDFVKLAEQKKVKKEEPSELPSKLEHPHFSMCVFQKQETGLHAQMKAIADDLQEVRTRTVRTEQACRKLAVGLRDKSVLERLRLKAMERGEERTGRVRMQYTWTDQEKITAFHCFVRYGRDFEAVAEVVGTKTPDMVKSLYTELKEDIDKIIDEAEEEDRIRAESLDRESLVKPPVQPIVVVNID